ncbi:glycosyltransferase family 2 protein [Sphaerospermopsis aphanizomenoides BCCUSP55]|uniref:glycosyltransferase family 2 protein n=1 Tax=Sphaerospermopsis aphanizomenoides TaxID=459663 RepID=UPI0019082F0E|nr:glycosyltransferase family A protein [Sphaerospermopsis aphanizomenoides]MBK1987109.1 glycosyltransferase family 2 protein [Sphaerospermopsis aphanizomenoides BCCUSP55]
MNPKVSILIPCYNAEKWIAQAIESALNQTYSNKEVIVVDDGSTDESLAVIQSFGDSIRWQTGENRGGNVARNRLLELSTGEWLQYLDADDYLLPRKIEQQINFLDQVTSADIIYSPSIFEYWESKMVKQEIFPIPEPHDPWILLALWYLPQTGSPLWKKQAILDVGGWKADQPVCQEHNLYLRLLKAGKKFEYCHDSGSVYRQWSESTVCKKDKTLTYHHRLAITEQLESHLKLINELNNERLYAINKSRFDCARMIWLFNSSWAKSIIKKIYDSEHDFKLPSSKVTIFYQIIYHFLGFEAAEITAKFKRELQKIIKQSQPIKNY